MNNIGDSKIYLITTLDQPTDRYGAPCGPKELVVSHGVGDYSLKNYCLPTEHPRYFSPKRDEMGQYIPADFDQ